MTPSPTVGDGERPPHPIRWQFDASPLPRPFAQKIFTGLAGTPEAMPSRRACLASLPALALAGCAGRSGNPSETATATASPTASATSNDPGVDIRDDASVTFSVRYVRNYDHNGVYAVEGKQFVFLSLDDTDEPHHSLSAFSMLADGDPSPATTFEGVEPHALGANEPVYEYDNPFERGDTGWVCFVVPANLDDPPELRVASDDGTHRLPVPGAERALQPPPAWEFTASAPESVPSFSTFDIEISAENVGDGAGVFRGAVNFENISAHTETFEFALGPGESGSATVQAESGSGGQTFGYGVETAGGDTTLSVDILSGTASDTVTTDEE